MARFLTVILASTASIVACSAQAAGPVDASPPASLPRYVAKGIVEVGLINREAKFAPLQIFDFAPIEEDSMTGGYGLFSVWGGSETVLFGLDAHMDLMSFGDVRPHKALTPGSLLVAGAHVGTTIDMTYLGMFGAAGSYPNSDQDQKVMGYAAGVEGTIDVGPATVFGKVGYAAAYSETYAGTGPDQYEGMVGPFTEAGAVLSLTDNLAVMVTVGLGYSDDFDRADNPGGYAAWGSKIALGLPSDLGFNLTASYDGYYAFTELDQDESIEHTIKIGLSKPLGDTSAEASLAPLMSPLAPFRAGFSSDKL